MQKVKNAIKKALKVDYNSHVNLLKNLKYIGSHHHGYFVPEKIIHENSICYCIGAGLDISFDTELVVKYGAKVFIFDPAPEAKNHFLELKEKTAGNKKLTIGNAQPFTYRISTEQLESIQFIEMGLWNKESTLKFFKSSIEGYPSHSIELFNGASTFIEAPVDRLKNLMHKLGHTYIDLLKLEIEGAEYVVLKTVIEDKLDVKMILVEFDELFHAKDFMYLFRIKKATEDLQAAGYVLAHSTPYFKRLFVKQDVFDALAMRESSTETSNKFK